MATKSKLEVAVEKQAKNLDDAQRELVLSQFSTYKWNKNRMQQIEGQLRLMDMRPPSDDPKIAKIELQRRKALTSERGQLTTANNSIASKLFMQLKDTGDNTDDFDAFLKG